jgi:hypothetical protein
MNSFLVRAPYRNSPITPTFKEAKLYFERRAQMMGIEVKWYKGRGYKDDGVRYHYWTLFNEVDANAFYLAVGDHIKQNGVRKKK